MASRRALVKHLWAMVQTRAEAASLVVKLQRTAMTQGLLLYLVAGFAAMAFATAVIVLIAVAAPPEWRVLALGIMAAALLATAIVGAVTAGRRLTRDAGLIEDFSRGLRLDMAMINLALKDPETKDEEEIEERERAKTRVREAAIAKAATPSTAEGSEVPSSTGPSADVASAAMRAAAPEPLPTGATERERPEPPVTVPESMTARLDRGDIASDEVGSEGQRNREQIRGRA